MENLELPKKYAYCREVKHLDADIEPMLRVYRNSPATIELQVMRRCQRLVKFMKKALAITRNPCKMKFMGSAVRTNNEPEKIMIKVIAQNAFETVETKEAAIETAKTFEENGYGVAKFEMLDDDGVWVEVAENDL